MFPSLKIFAIAIAVSLAGGGAIGARVQKKIDNGAYYRAVAAAKDKKIAALEGQIQTRDAAAKADTARAVADALERQQLESKGHEIENKSSDRVCFDAAAGERLRQLWGPGQPRPGRPAAGAR